jgi:transposase
MLARADACQERAMRPIRLDGLSQQQLGELDRLYHTTRDVRVRTRAQMILLAAERGLVAAEIAAIVRQDEETVRRWLARYEAEGAAGLSDAPRAGAPPKITPAYRERLLQVVRQRPRGLGLPFSLWCAPPRRHYRLRRTAAPVGG